MDLKDVEFWSVEKLIENVSKLSSRNSRFDKNLGEEISKFLKSSVPDAKQHERTSKEWLFWCNQQKSRVKVSEYDVPAGILGPKLNGCLYDMKVQSKGPDDAAYNKYSDLRQKVARGNSVLYLHDLETNCPSHDGIVFALKKFTGGMGDEDDNQPDSNSDWMLYFIKSLSSAQKVVCTRKANGEAAHLSVRFLPRTGFVLCVGSKNVHMIVRNFSDVEKYKDSRFQVARTVAESVLGLILARPNEGGLEVENLTILLNFLHHSKLTAVYEILQPHYQHVEDLSYLGDTCELNLITFTSPYAEEKNVESLCAISPDVALEFATALGMKTVQYEVIEAAHAEDRMDKVRRDRGYEGEVFYYLDSKDRVIGLLKKKTTWYVVSRAIREKAAAASNEYRKSGSSTWNPKKWETRINQIQRWLGFSDDFKNVWISLGNGFIRWLLEELKKGGKFSTSESLNVRGKFPVLWKRFLSEKSLKDDLPWS